MIWHWNSYVIWKTYKKLCRIEYVFHKNSFECCSLSVSLILMTGKSSIYPQDPSSLRIINVLFLLSISKGDQCVGTLIACTNPTGGCGFVVMVQARSLMTACKKAWFFIGRLQFWEGLHRKMCHSAFASSSVLSWKGEVTLWSYEKIRSELMLCASWRNWN